MPRAKPAPAASRSGSYVHESQRRTVQVKLRVAPAVADEIRARAEASGMTSSAVISALVMATAADT